jgi:hypothetical protein
MKLDINKIELKEVAPNIYQLLHDNEQLKFWSPILKVPFGIDNEYNKYLLRLELNDEEGDQQHFKKIILHIEKLIKKKLNLENIEFKIVIRDRKNSNSLIETKIKTVKKIITTAIEFEDKDNNYLKTIFDLPKQSNVKIQLEIYGLWDYRNEKNESNKIGLIVYVNKIIVLN